MHDNLRFDVRRRRCDNVVAIISGRKPRPEPKFGVDLVDGMIIAPTWLPPGTVITYMAEEIGKVYRLFTVVHRHIVRPRLWLDGPKLPFLFTYKNGSYIFRFTTYFQSRSGFGVLRQVLREGPFYAPRPMSPTPCALDRQPMPPT